MYPQSLMIWKNEKHTLWINYTQAKNEIQSAGLQKLKRNQKDREIKISEARIWSGSEHERGVALVKLLFYNSKKVELIILAASGWR
jgi:hypothetical protein